MTEIVLLAIAVILLTAVFAIPTTPEDDEPVCTCPETDPVKRSTAYTVRHFNHEPHAADCPRRDMIKKSGPS